MPNDDINARIMHPDFQTAMKKIGDGIDHVLNGPKMIGIPRRVGYLVLAFPIDLPDPSAVAHVTNLEDDAKIVHLLRVKATGMVPPPPVGKEEEDDDA